MARKARVCKGARSLGPSSLRVGRRAGGEELSGVALFLGCFNKVMDSVVATAAKVGCYPRATSELGEGSVPGRSMTEPQPAPSQAEIEPHPIWKEKKYYKSNNWGKISKEERERVRRHRVEGVEVRDLPEGHKLHGEQGLFATRKFKQYDVLGEYTGLIVGHHSFGHYVASLEDVKDHESSLGIDAATCGNEMRFINSFIGLAFTPNVTLRTAYVDTLPHILIVCIADIEVGDEILLDYGKAYNNAYLLAKPNVTVTMSDEKSLQAWGELAGADSSDSDKD